MGVREARRGKGVEQQLGKGQGLEPQLGRGQEVGGQCQLRVWSLGS